MMCYRNTQIRHVTMSLRRLKFPTLSSTLDSEARQVGSEEDPRGVLRMMRQRYGSGLTYPMETGDDGDDDARFSSRDDAGMRMVDEVDGMRKTRRRST
ncbi:hypothetical protein Tco_0280286 [Tanacetum coccineum]